jgi:3'-5' exoribonuclease
MTPVNKLKSLANYYGVSDIANVVLEDKRFSYWSGSSSPLSHHYGNGGLAIHVLEVVELCMSTNEYFCSHKNVNKQKLFLAALFHDAGKMWDYEHCNSTEWRANYHKKAIHHISRSALVWNEAKIKYNFNDDEDEVLHAILAHHGSKEYGSPVQPLTRLAWILHLCDSLSARMDDCDKKRDLIK